MQNSGSSLRPMAVGNGNDSKSVPDNKPSENEIDEKIELITKEVKEGKPGARTELAYYLTQKGIRIEYKSKKAKEQRKDEEKDKLYAQAMEKYTEALTEYERAADEEKSNVAMFCLGRLYEGKIDEQGIAKGVEQDLNKALYWYMKAEEHQHPEASQKIKALKDRAKNPAPYLELVIFPSTAPTFFSEDGVIFHLLHHADPGLAREHKEGSHSAYGQQASFYRNRIMERLRSPENNKFCEEEFLEGKINFSGLKKFALTWDELRESARKKLINEDIEKYKVLWKDGPEVALTLEYLFREREKPIYDALLRVYLEIFYKQLRPETKNNLARFAGLYAWLNCVRLIETCFAKTEFSAKVSLQNDSYQVTSTEFDENKKVQIIAVSFRFSIQIDGKKRLSSAPNAILLGHLEINSRDITPKYRYDFHLILSNELTELISSLKRQVAHQELNDRMRLDALDDYTKIQLLTINPGAADISRMFNDRDFLEMNAKSKKHSPLCYQFITAPINLFSHSLLSAMEGIPEAFKEGKLTEYIIERLVDNVSDFSMNILIRADNNDELKSFLILFKKYLFSLSSNSQERADGKVLGIILSYTDKGDIIDALVGAFNVKLAENCVSFQTPFRNYLTSIWKEIFNFIGDKIKLNMEGDFNKIKSQLKEDFRQAHLKNIYSKFLLDLFKTVADPIGNTVELSRKGISQLYNLLKYDEVYREAILEFLIQDNEFGDLASAHDNETINKLFVLLLCLSTTKNEKLFNDVKNRIKNLELLEAWNNEFKIINPPVEVWFSFLYLYICVFRNLYIEGDKERIVSFVSILEKLKLLMNEKININNQNKYGKVYNDIISDIDEKINLTVSWCLPVIAGSSKKSIFVPSKINAESTELHLKRSRRTECDTSHQEHFITSQHDPLAIYYHPLLHERYVTCYRERGIIKYSFSEYLLKIKNFAASQILMMDELESQFFQWNKVANQMLMIFEAETFEIKELDKCIKNAVHRLETLKGLSQMEEIKKLAQIHEKRNKLDSKLDNDAYYIKEILKISKNKRNIDESGRIGFNETYEGSEIKDNKPIKPIKGYEAEAIKGRVTLKYLKIIRLRNMLIINKIDQLVKTLNNNWKQKKEINERDRQSGVQWENALANLSREQWPSNLTEGFEEKLSSLKDKFNSLKKVVDEKSERSLSDKRKLKDIAWMIKSALKFTNSLKSNSFKSRLKFDFKIYYLSQIPEGLFYQDQNGVNYNYIYKNFLINFYRRTYGNEVVPAEPNKFLFISITHWMFDICVSFQLDPITKKLIFNVFDANASITKELCENQELYRVNTITLKNSMRFRALVLKEASLFPDFISRVIQSPNEEKEQKTLPRVDGNATVMRSMSSPLNKPPTTPVSQMKDLASAISFLNSNELIINELRGRVNRFAYALESKAAFFTSSRKPQITPAVQALDNQGSLLSHPIPAPKAKSHHLSLI